MSSWIRIVAAGAAVLLAGGVAAGWASARRTEPAPDLTGFDRHTVLSADGTEISYLSLGSGPDLLVVVPGSLTMAADYAELARALADRFSVHVVDRRGHGTSGPQGPDYDVSDEVADVVAVQAATHAEYLVGHSYGGFVALEAAKRGRFAAVAVYDPGMSVGGSMSTAWMDRAERHVAAGDDLDALTEFVRGTTPDAGRTPHWLLKAILPQVIRRNRRQQMYDLMPTALREHRELARLDDTYPSYAAIAAPLLVLNGSESGPAMTSGAERLADVVPHVTRVTLDGLDHFGPDRTGPGEVARAITDFFGRHPA